MNSINPDLPGLGFEVLNPEVRGNNCTVRELATRQRLKSGGSRIGAIVLNEDLASTVSAAGDLHSKNLSNPCRLHPRNGTQNRTQYNGSSGHHLLS